jgi:hypothetical protein
MPQHVMKSSIPTKDPNATRAELPLNARAFEQEFCGFFGKRYVSQRINYANLLISSCKQLDLKGYIKALETTTTEYQKLIKAA